MLLRRTDMSHATVCPHPFVLVEAAAASQEKRVRRWLFAPLMEENRTGMLTMARELLVGVAIALLTQ